MFELNFEHVGICVTNISESQKWYETNFGFETVKTFEKSSLEIKGVLLRNSNCVIELLEPNSKVTDPRRDLIPQEQSEQTLVKGLQNLGANHFAVSTSDIDECFAALKSNGVRLLTKIIESKMFFCEDLDGNLIEVKRA